MDSYSGRLHDGVVRGSRPLGRPSGDLVRAPVLRSAMQRHEADGRAQDALLPDAGQAQEFSEVDVVSLAPPGALTQGRRRARSPELAFGGLAVRSTVQSWPARHFGCDLGAVVKDLPTSYRVR